ncbi:MAG: type IV pilus modification protein PilV [Rhodocyclales bacterium GWA2_65_19]|nr:MAG: type IV pilus modification protein PilV [Rhodocyclales bacterium GWA2_65_19]
MIEVLVTMIIVAFSLLGMAGMQALSLKTQKDASLRSVAVVTGLDLVERLEYNLTGALAGNYVETLPKTFTTVADCSTVACTAQQMAIFDLNEFQTLLNDRLPGATATITSAGSGPVVYTVVINWTQRMYAARGTTVAATVGAVASNDVAYTNTAGSGTETFSYTMTRRIYNRLAVM